MSSELSAILDHIENINELDLEGVEPTSHVVSARERAARGRAAAELAARDRCSSSPRTPRDGGFRVPSPGRMSELLDLTAAQAGERIARRRVVRD